MSPVMQPMTYEELGSIYRREQDVSYLVPVRSDFYRAVADLVIRMRQEYVKQVAIDPDSVISEGINAKRRHADYMIKSVIAERTKKICKTVIRATQGSDEALTAFTPEERNLFEQLEGPIKRQINIINHYMGSNTVETHIEDHLKLDEPDEMPAFEEPEVGQEAPAVQEEAAPMDVPTMDDVPETFDDPIMEESFDDMPDIPMDEDVKEVLEPIVNETVEDVEKDSIVLRVLEDLPPFVGPDRDYNLHKEDIVTLPMQMAMALINSKKAVAVTPGL